MYRKVNYLNIDSGLMLSVILLSCFGLMVLASASYQTWLFDSKNYVLRQVLWIGLGMLVMWLIIKFNYTCVLSLAYVLYFLNLVILVLLLVIGHVSMGAQRWFNLGGFTFQPSEFSKIILILTLARIMSDYPQRQKRLGFFIFCFFVTFVPMVLIALQPDLGTAIIFMPILFAMLYVGGANIKHIISFAALGISASPLFWHFLKDYQRNRLLVFINPNLDPLGAGYTIIQSKIAIGSGRFFGKGWYSGTQNQLNFLPERHTDFIFSVVGEEWGFLGALILIILYFIFIMRTMQIAKATNVSSARLVAVGVIAMMTGHIIINISMTIGLMPVVGLPLPFLSYGGSYMVSIFILLGLLLSINKTRSIF